MRTLRLSLVGAVILAFAGGIGAVTSAQAESDTPASNGSTLLSFTLPYPEPSTPGVVELVDDRRFTHEGVFRFTLDSGDPRLSGEMWTINSHYTFPDSGGNVWVGFAGLDDEGGAWRGTYHGYGTPYNERTYLQVDLTGSDAYDGLSAILFATDNGTGFDVEGMIFPGGLPPMPEKEEPSAVTGPMAPASFTFTLEPVEESSNQGMSEVMRGHQDTSAIESSDARASGLLTSTVNWNIAVSEGSGALSAAMSQRLSNDGGAWVGEGWGMLAGFEGSSRMARMTVLTGEGHYEGLTLVLSHAWDAEGELGWGIIVPSDEFPPMPDPVPVPAG